MDHTIKRPVARKIQTQADIVFCVDATGSMSPCIQGVRDGILTFVENLQTSASVDFRLRLIGYRDLHDPACGTAWVETPFISSPEEFRNHVAALKATGGGDAPESTLDALFRALKSDWRSKKTHKTVVLLTDADTHPTLHRSTYHLPDNDVYRVIQEFQTLRHVMLFMVAPRYPLYETIEKAMDRAYRKVVAYWVPTDGQDMRYRGLAAVQWQVLMQLIGQTVSATSVETAGESE